MYGKEYAQAWIADYESGKDIMRSKYIMPAIETEIRNLPSGSKILDVGCGWGIALKYLREDQEYYGIDITEEFFDYIKGEYPAKNVHLNRGMLPGPFDFEEDYFDLIICSMSLHTIDDLEKSFQTIFSCLKPSGRILVIDFRDGSKELIVPRFSKGSCSENHCKGLYMLDCGLKVESEVFFHKEKDYEHELSKHGTWSKKDMGPVFIGYSATKKLQAG